MGLDTSHDCWSGSYGSFNEFRRVLAETINMDLNRMIGFGQVRVSNSHDFIIEEPQLRWHEVPKDDLHILLNHSDCEGIIENKDCLALATRLQELAPLIEEKYYRDRAIQFAEGLIEAHHAGDDVEFQ